MKNLFNFPGNFSTRHSSQRREMLRASIVGTASAVAFGSSINANAAASQKVNSRISYFPSQIDAEIVKALQNIPRSVLLYDIAQVESTYRDFKAADADVQIHYAVKCAPNRRVMVKLVKLGSGFDVASRVEVDLALEAGAEPIEMHLLEYLQSPRRYQLCLFQGN